VTRTKLHITRFYSVGVFLIACILIGACSQTPERPALKFTGRLLLLSGTGANGADLMELTTAPGGNTHNLSTIASGVFEAAPNPDQSQLLYSTKDQIILRDLHSGAVKSLINGPGFCLAWSPDGKRFTYQESGGAASKSTKFYVYDLEGKTKLIWEDSSGAESADNRYCAHWTAPDRIVFDRFAGIIPKASSEKIKPNTTTVATVGDSVTFVDGERKWSIQGVCPSGSVLLSPADQAQPIFIARTTDHFEKLNPTPGPSEGRFIGFAAKSCVPFFIQQPTSTTTDLFSLNPTNWQQLRSASISATFTPAAKMLIRSSARLMVVGDAPDKLLLIDTESGDVTSFFPESATAARNAGPLQSPAPVVWIEN
jgi:hypothetical protein